MGMTARRSIKTGTLRMTRLSPRTEPATTSGPHWFWATVSGTTLELRAGASWTRWSAACEQLPQGTDPDAVLELHAGDRLLVCGPTTDETLVARVTSVNGARVEVEWRRGELDATTSEVRVTKTRPA